MRTVAQALHRAMSHAEIQVPRVKLGNQGLEVNGSNSFLKLVQFSFYYSCVLGFNMNYIFFFFFLVCEFWVLRFQGWDLGVLG